MARDGVVLYALLHRALQTGGASLGHAQHREAGMASLGDDTAVWESVSGEGPADQAIVLAGLGQVGHDRGIERLAGLFVGDDLDRTDQADAAHLADQLV